MTGPERFHEAKVRWQHAWDQYLADVFEPITPQTAERLHREKAQLAKLRADVHEAALRYWE